MSSGKTQRQWKITCMLCINSVTSVLITQNKTSIMIRFVDFISFVNVHPFQHNPKKQVGTFNFFPFVILPRPLITLEDDGKIKHFRCHCVSFSTQIHHVAACFFSKLCTHSLLGAWQDCIQASPAPVLSSISAIP